MAPSPALVQATSHCHWPGWLVKRQGGRAPPIMVVAVVIRRSATDTAMGMGVVRQAVAVTGMVTVMELTPRM